MERTLLMIKPDGVNRKLIGEVIKRVEQSDLKIAAMKMQKPTKEFGERFYPDIDEWYKSVGDRAKTAFEKQNLDVKKYYGTDIPIEMGKVVKKWLVDFISSGSVVAMVVEGENAIQRVRKLCGNTYPDLADKGTIRGDLGTDTVEKANSEGRSIQNIVHASGSKEEAEKEINLWFKEKEICKI
jgi:nucleoside-diphosphate kinase